MIQMCDVSINLIIETIMVFYNVESVDMIDGYLYYKNQRKFLKF